MKAVSGLYDSLKKAQSAALALLVSGYAENSIRVVSTLATAWTSVMGAEGFLLTVRCDTEQQVCRGEEMLRGTGAIRVQSRASEGAFLAY